MMTDEEKAELERFTKEFVESQKDLDDDSREILYRNLWDLYE